MFGDAFDFNDIFRYPQFVIQGGSGSFESYRFIYEAAKFKEEIVRKQKLNEDWELPRTAKVFGVEKSGFGSRYFIGYWADAIRFLDDIVDAKGLNENGYLSCGNYLNYKNELEPDTGNPVRRLDEVVFIHEKYKYHEGLYKITVKNYSQYGFTIVVNSTRHICRF